LLLKEGNRKLDLDETANQLPLAQLVQMQQEWQHGRNEELARSWMAFVELLRDQTLAIELTEG
jgi:hypothetical protein